MHFDILPRLAMIVLGSRVWFAADTKPIVD
jgi:hypothetical protein